MLDHLKGQRVTDSRSGITIVDVAGVMTLEALTALVRYRAYQLTPDPPRPVDAPRRRRGSEYFEEDEQY